MPLLVGGASYTTAVATAAAGSVWWVTKASSSRGTIAATWTDPDGVVYPLTQPWADPTTPFGHFTMDGPASWGSTPIELVTDPYSRGGEVVRFIRAQPRRIQWPLYVGGRSHTDFVTGYRSIMRAFTKTTYRRAPGILEIKRPDGSLRRIWAFYEQGFEGEAGENWIWAKPVITLFCPDGYFYDPVAVSVERTIVITRPGTSASFYAPFITIGGVPVYDDSPTVTTMTNPGDVESWPVWELTGPLGGFAATNDTSGVHFAFNYDIPAGETVTINTNPASVRDSTGQNLSRYIDWFADEGVSLWSFQPGANRVTFNLTVPSDGSVIRVKFLPRYETC